MKPFFFRRHWTLFSVSQRNLYSQLFPCSSDKSLEMEIFFDGIIDPNCWGKIKSFKLPYVQHINTELFSFFIAWNLHIWTRENWAGECRVSFWKMCHREEKYGWVRCEIVGNKFIPDRNRIAASTSLVSLPFWTDTLRMRFTSAKAGMG